MTLLAGTMLSSAAIAGPTLPTGGGVAAGTASIGGPAGGSLTVTQTSSKAILNWADFSIGQGGSVQFNNGSGATLNRVTGASVSSIEGTLGATGSVYLINPNGVIIGKTGVVQTGGSFVASTLSMANDAFLSGGPMQFTGGSQARVVNLGKIGSLGGDVALIATTVSNAGALSAPNGSAALVSGAAVVMNDAGLDGGRFTVTLPATGGSVTNAGAIDAAVAELRANGGDVYALAGDTSGVIRATGVAAGGGRVFLIADGGRLTANGVIQAKGADGSGGAIETSGASVQLDGAKIATGAGGSWLIDPVNLTIDAAAASAIATGLASASVTVQTTATGASGAGNQTAGAGDITLAAPISWSSANGLTLSAYRNINLNANLTDSVAAKVVLAADNSATGTGTVSFAAGVTAAIHNGEVDIFYNPASYADAATKSTQTYTGSSTPDSTVNPYKAFVTDGATTAAFMLVNSLAQLQAINTELDGVYALNADIDASSTATTPFTILADGSSAANHFTGALNGRGHVIDRFTLTATADDVGLFGFIDSGASVTNLGLTNVAITGSGGVRNGSNVSGDAVGALAGYANGTMDNVYATGSVSGYSQVGGLVGVGYVSISNSHSDATVTGKGNSVGGLVGEADGALTNTYATGAVSSGSGTSGGLVGYLFGTISNSHATGAVTDSDGFGAGVGGLVGDVNGRGNGVVLDSYATGAVTGGYQYTGGLIGLLDCGGTGCGVARVYATGAVTGGPGENYVGGLVGYATNTTLSNAYAGGAVTTTGQYVGGLIGDLESATVTNAYATGAVSGANTVGGLVGELVGTAAVTGVYSTGPVTATNTTPSAVGGLVGSGAASASLSNAYWDEGTTGQTSAVGGTVALPQTNVTGIGGTTGLSPYLASTYTNFDLVNTWYSFGASLGGSGYLGGELRPLLRFEYSTTIVNAHQLAMIELDRGATYTLGADIDLSVTQNPSDVWNPALGFYPIGYLGQKNELAVGFYGTLDGAGHTIRNLTITPSGLSQQFGLFSQLASTGIIENLTLSGGVVNGDDIVGALVGGSAGTVRNDHSDVAVNGGTNVGGLVGYNAATGVISGSSSSGAVAGNRNGSSRIGGLVGQNNGAVDGSFATGTVAISANLVGGNVGGLVGQNGGNGTEPGSDTTYDGTGGPNAITNSYASGAVNAAGSSQVGGLVGISYNPLSGVYASGSVTGASYVGGLLGYAAFAGPLSNVHASGDVTGSSSSIGGLVGVGDGSVTNAYATGSVSGAAGSSGVGGLLGTAGAATVITNANASGDVSGGSNVGGLVGFNQGSMQTVSATGAVSGQSGVGGLIGNSDGATVTIASASATGAVTAPTSGSAGSNVGGLIGNLSGGAVTASTASGAVTGNSYVGGLVGNSTFAIANDSSTVYATISGSHATGAVTGGSEVGGLTGYLTGGSVADSYATGAVSGQFDVGGAIGFVASGAAVTGSAVGKTYASGAVTGTGDSIGGFAGGNFGSLTLVAYTPEAGGVDGGTPSGGAVSVGGLVGANGGTIAQARSTGNVQGRNQVGGLVGDSTGGSVNGDAFGSVTGAGYVGGLVGRNYAAITNSTANGPVSGGGGTGGLVGVNEAGSTITTATVTGAVNGVNGFGNGSDVGGLAGANFGTVSGAVASGAVTGKDHTGGLIGYNSGAVTNGSASGAVIGEAYVGGLIGLNYAAVLSSQTTGSVGGVDYVGGLVGWNAAAGAVRNSTASGLVTGGTSYLGDPTAPPGFYDNAGSGGYVGGFAGVNQGVLDSDIASGSASVSGTRIVGGLVGLNQGTVSYSSAARAVTGDQDVGGLVGWNDTSATISKSSSTGAVTGRPGGQDAITQDDYVGGLIGVNFGQASDVYASGAVSGVQVVGGLVGANMPGGANITNAYATGAVTASRGAAGGFAGVQAGTVTNGYYQPATTGQANGVGYAAAASAPTAIGPGTQYDAGAQTTYQGFDFTGTWQAQPSAPPTLRARPS